MPYRNILRNCLTITHPCSSMNTAMNRAVVPHNGRMDANSMSGDRVARNPDISGQTSDTDRIAANHTNASMPAISIR